jgi:hypothetical protein
MIAWIKKINWGRTVLVGFLYSIVALIVDTLVGGAKAGIMSFVITLATGISIAVIYYYTKDLLQKKFLNRMLFFADLMIGFSFIFFTLPAYMIFNVPLGTLAVWFAGTFIKLVYASFITVKFIGM